MTISNPLPVDKPDFSSPVNIATRLLFQDEGYIVGNTSNGPINVEQNTAITFRAEIDGGAWVLYFYWSLSNAYGVDVLYTTTYEGTAYCVVIDTLPVLAPWFSYEVLDAHTVGGMHLDMNATTSPQSSRGATFSPNHGSVIQEDPGVCPPNVATYFDGGYLSPGLYSYVIYSRFSFAGFIDVYGLDASGGIHRMVHIYEPGAGVTYAGQFIMMEAQIQVQVNNQTAATQNVSISIMGPL